MDKILKIMDNKNHVDHNFPTSYSHPINAHLPTSSTGTTTTTTDIIYYIELNKKTLKSIKNHDKLRKTTKNHDKTMLQTLEAI